MARGKKKQQQRPAKEAASETLYAIKGQSTVKALTVDGEQLDAETTEDGQNVFRLEPDQVSGLAKAGFVLEPVVVALEQSEPDEPEPENEGE